MKLVTIQMTLGFLDDELDFNDKEAIADYLSNMLYQDPEFFGNFGQENIIDVKEIDD